jgi:hypothetical protein
MRLGIVVAGDVAIEPVVGLAAAAAERGWECRCFLTDRGVRLLNAAPLIALARDGRLRVDVCEHSWEKYGAGAPPPHVNLGSQYQNAELAHLCDRVIVL